jgi:hypothetical protein
MEPKGRFRAFRSMTLEADAVPFQEKIAEPIALGRRAERFYTEALQALAQSGIPFLLAGTYAVSAYTGISRETKDIDVFCKVEDVERIRRYFEGLGYRTEMHDPRWIAKVWKGKHFLDVIFASSNSAVPITDEWFEHARRTEVLGTEALMAGPTELIWSKVFVQNRDRFDGADVTHVILKHSADVDWHRLLRHMNGHWEVLLAHLIYFRWIYPGERDVIPSWLMRELMARLEADDLQPAPETNLCRGRMLSKADYRIDVTEWGYEDPLGEAPRDEWR